MDIVRIPTQRRLGGVGIPWPSCLRLLIWAPCALGIVTIVLSGCGGSAGSDGDGDLLVDEGLIAVDPVPSETLFLQAHETERVRLFTSEPTALGVDFSEADSGISIDTGGCVPASDLCREWSIRPGRDAPPGNHAIPVLALAEGDQIAMDGNAAVALTVFPPVRTPPVLSGATADAPVFSIGSGGNVKFVVDSAGALWGWGADLGVLGAKIGRPPVFTLDRVRPELTEALARRGPAPIGGESVVALAVGGAADVPELHVLALGADGAVWAWGTNSRGQLGDGSTAYRSRPERVQMMDGTRTLAAQAVAAGLAHSLALDTEGSLWAWGRNNRGQLGLGDGTRDNRVRAVAVGSAGGRSLVRIAAGSWHSLALADDGSVWAWGRNDRGQLGDGSREDRDRPVQVQGLSGIVSIAAGQDHNLARDVNDNLWAWGANEHGQLGNGRLSEDRDLPVQVQGLSGILLADIARGASPDLAAGRAHSLALGADGTVWAFGANDQGQLGDGTLENRLSPVGVRMAARAIGASADSSFAVARECEEELGLWAWGANSWAELGVGVTGGSSRVPVRVAGIAEATACGGRRLMIYLTGSGAVASDSATLQCLDGARLCWDFLPLTSTVTLTAVPDVEGEFDGWHWDCMNASLSTTVIMDDHKYCKVRFASRNAVLVVTPRGNGRIASDPAGIDCPEDCSESFALAGEPRRVALTAVADPGWRFDRWSGDCAGTDSPVEVAMSTDRTCDALFEELDSGTFTLNVARGGTGSGTVTSDPPGITCGPDCSEAYAANTLVTLTAMPGSGSQFSHWEGGADCPDGTLASGTVALVADTQCTAVFDLTLTTATLSVAIDELVGSAFTASGRVTSTPPGIDCGLGNNDCAETYALGNVVTLIPQPGEGAVFFGWNGDLACADAHVSGVLLDRSRFCEAVFDNAVSSERATLTVAVTGSGTVSTSDGAVVCPGDCAEIFTFNETVLLSANPGPGQVLLGWGGDCASAGSNATFTVALLGDTSCTAAFGLAPQSFTLTVSLNGPGTIRVFQAGTQVQQCPTGGSACSLSYPSGTPLVLTWADSGPNQDFLGWGGDCAGRPQSSQSSLNLTIDRDYTCSALSE